MTRAGHPVRPTLTAAPAALGAVEEILRGRVVREVPARAGFTRSVASAVACANGARAFVKAGPVGTDGGEAVSVGAQLAPVVGDLGPALLGHAVVEGWSVAVYDRIEGQALTTWDDQAVKAMAALSVRLRERLDPSPVSDTTPYADAFAPLLGTWAALTRRDHPDRHTVAHVAGLALPYGLDAVRLAALEDRWFDALGSGTALQHGDLRADNVVREPGGRLWLVDWTHRWAAPGWADLVRLAPDLAANGGHDPQVFLTASAWGADAPREGVDVMLAGLAGRCWRDGHLPEVPGLPGLRAMQRDQGQATLRWLAARLGAR